MPRETIPARVSDLTPEWLTRVLRQRGVLKTARVRAVDAESLGAGRGFIGRLARLHLELDVPEPGAPATLVAKLPLERGINRALGETSGSYEREIRVYEELAPELAIRTPRCYYAAMDPFSLSAHAPTFLRALEKLPHALLLPLLRGLLWLGARSPRRYVLLLEDLAPATAGDQLAGCSPERAAQALSALARLQAPLWESPRLDALRWLQPADLGAGLFHAFYLDAWRRTRGSRFWPAHAQPFGEWLSRRGPELYARIARPPHTLIHGDFRLDNLFFDAGGVRGEIAAVDWQVCLRGRGAFDAAYFLSGNLEPDVAAAHADELLRGYCDELAQRGVRGYDLATCRLDCERSIALLVHRWVMLEANVIELDHERGDQLIEAGVKRLIARMPEPPWDRLLD